MPASASPPHHAYLTIRNILSVPVELRRVVFGDHVKPISHTDRPNGHTSTTERYAAVHVQPLDTAETDVDLDANIAKTFRMSFFIGSEEFSLSCQKGVYQCQNLKPLEPSPSLQITAIYLPATSFIALFSSKNMQSWMSELIDATPISGLSIPGTHNSPAYHRALPSVRCQAVSPLEQLQNGVRFFDIRVQVDKPSNPSSDSLTLVHSVFSVTLAGRKYFRDLLNDVLKFLKEHPSEFVIMSLKREGATKATDEQLSKILYTHYASDHGKWFTAPRIPYLGEVRGKIVLLRRFHLDDSLKGEYGGAGWGIDGSVWEDNTKNALTPSGHLRIQDWYQVMSPIQFPEKAEYVKAHLARASRVIIDLPKGGGKNAMPEVKQPVHLNFLSASNFFNPGCWPERIAAKINPQIVEYLCRMHNNAKYDKDGNGIGDGCTGTVVCDWVGTAGNWDIVRAVVGMNVKLEMREKS